MTSTSAHATQTVRLCHLYPSLMNIYADRGNISVIARRLQWRGFGLAIDEVGLGDDLAPDAHDLYYLGGGQDRDQNLVAADLITKASVLRGAADNGAAQLYVCGGIQLAGHGYETVDGQYLEGTGVLDLDTVAGDTRLTGDLVIRADLDGDDVTIVGYENHAGRTYLGTAVDPLGRVVSGHGNNGTDRLEGARRDHVIGTYLHGPLLPRNPVVADLLLTWALEHRYGSTELRPLDDTLELSAHAVAIERAGQAR